MRKLTVLFYLGIVALTLLLGLAACGQAEVAAPAATVMSANTLAPPLAIGNESQIAAPPVPVTAFEPAVSTTFVKLFGEDTVVDGAQSTLYRMPTGIYMTFDTQGLQPGFAYTIWWVIFNEPENCSDSVCNLDDMALLDEDGARLLAEDGSPLPNLPQREETSFSLLRATGSIVDEDGTVEFRAHLPVGDAYEADYGPGLLNPMFADVHLVARSHGAAIPGRMHEQLNSAWGGCPEGWPKDPCQDTQVAIHSVMGN